MAVAEAVQPSGTNAPRQEPPTDSPFYLQAVNTKFECLLQLFSVNFFGQVIKIQDFLFPHMQMRGKNQHD